MRIQYCSDLHFEFSSNRTFLKDNPIIPTGEILLLAGDIMPLVELHRHKEAIDRLSSAFEAVYWVPGNHEYYHYNMAAKPTPLFEKIRTNFFLVNNTHVQYKHTHLVFSTLWSHIQPQHETIVQESVTDFSIISVGDKKLSAAHFNTLHRQSLAFLDNTLSTLPSASTIIVTHHVPTLLNYPPAYKNSPLTEAFAVELQPFIEQCGAAYWLYGHHHRNTPPFTIGGTQLITNQLGYVSYNEHKTFQPTACISIE